ncbi:MAG: flagellar protein FlaG [Nitrospiraceae bacterium]|nr:MAG: flagellar protein FlaG [Nitrospiraceae bacterium]
MIEDIIKMQDFDNASTKKIKRNDYPAVAGKKEENRGKVNTDDINRYENNRVKEAIDNIVSAANYFKRTIRIEIDNDIMIVKVVDEKTGKVIRQIPPEELVELSKNAIDQKGLLINEEG